MGEVKAIFLCAQATLAMTVSIAKAANNSAGAGMGEQDFDFAQADHFLKEGMYF